MASALILSRASDMTPLTRSDTSRLQYPGLVSNEMGGLAVGCGHGEPKFDNILSRVMNERMDKAFFWRKNICLILVHNTCAKPIPKSFVLHVFGSTMVNSMRCTAKLHDLCEFHPRHRYTLPGDGIDIVPSCTYARDNDKTIWYYLTAIGAMIPKKKTSQQNKWLKPFDAFWFTTNQLRPHNLCSQGAIRCKDKCLRDKLWK